ncbi:MAG TPA: hypothetical protein PK358_00475 [Spirochaetota bacterium]|nr:hypothetical protein [Spirochaetota bacterium]
MKNLFKIIFILLALSSGTGLFSSQFEELDKPPEGAHEGQMLLGGFFSIGIPAGDAITAEEDFVEGNTYTFSESQITKELVLNHLSYDFGVFFEYMPFDHVGAKSKLRRSVVVQRTAFGSDYQNWTENLYENYSLILGPSFHLTSRKQWDIVFTPEIGYAIAQYHATPIAAKLVSGYDGDRDRDVNGIIYGAELSLAIYFSGGFHLSLGGEWTNYPLAISPGYNLSQNGKTYEAPSSLQTMNFTVSAGYAFSN